MLRLLDGRLRTCPASDADNAPRPTGSDRTPSLSITLGKRAILVHCFAGCSNEAVMQAMSRLGVRISDLFDGPGEPIAVEPREDVADRNAQRLWREASIILGTAAERYLTGRGITLFGMPCWATLGNERFGLVTIPDSVRELHLFIDNDAGGRLAEERARDAHAREGRRIITRPPERPGDDWNDVLMRRIRAPA